MPENPDPSPEAVSRPVRSSREYVYAPRFWRMYASKLQTALFSAESSLLLILVMLALIGVFWVLLRDTAFMSIGNFMNIVKAKTPVIVMAVATVFVISAGEIDLSIASVPPVAGTLAATLLAHSHAMWLAVAAALAVGLVVGLTNGAITVLVGIPSFIVTLGMIGALEGVARLISGEQAVPIINDAYTSIFGSGNVGAVPVLLVWTLGIGVLGAVALRSTPFGKGVLATGGNEVAAPIRASELAVSRSQCWSSADSRGHWPAFSTQGSSPRGVTTSAGATYLPSSPRSSSAVPRLAVAAEAWRARSPEPC